MGNIRIPYGFNSIQGTELTTVKLRISLDRLLCGSETEHRQRGTVVYLKYYNRLSKVCREAGLKMSDGVDSAISGYCYIEGVTSCRLFRLRYKCIMADLNVYNARLEANFWASCLVDADPTSGAKPC